MRRTRSRQVGRSVVSGATTPNRNGLVPRVAVVSGIVPVLSFRPRFSAGFLHQLRTGPAVSTGQVQNFSRGRVSIRAVAFVGVVSGASGATEPKENAMSLTTTAPTVTAPRHAATRSARSLRRTTVVAALVAAAVHGAAYNSTSAAR